MCKVWIFALAVPSAAVVSGACGGAVTSEMEQPALIEATPQHDTACAPMDARGDDKCRALVGHAWDGTKCVDLWGCECLGADCARAQGAACEELQATCAGDAGAETLPEAGGKGTHICDRRRVGCRQSEPACPAGQTASVAVEDANDPTSVGCWGPCVDVTACRCSGPSGSAECPEGYACWGFEFACGPLTR